MADINEVLSNLCSDLKAVGQEVGRRTGDAVELSRLKLERLKLKNRVRGTMSALAKSSMADTRTKRMFPTLLRCSMSSLTKILRKSSAFLRR